MEINKITNLLYMVVILENDIKNQDDIVLSVFYDISFFGFFFFLYFIFILSIFTLRSFLYVTKFIKLN